MRIIVLMLLLAVLGTSTLAQDWPQHGNDPGGSTWSPLTQINRDNVAQLEVAWIYRTGETDQRGNFEATPIVFDGRLYVSTPFDEVIALDPATGEERWRYDPALPRDSRFFAGYTSRGVSSWADAEAADDAVCARRIFLGTMDARLIALDAVTGEPCADFDDDGQVDLTEGIDNLALGQYQVTSPPAIINDLVITGSSIADNRAIEVEQGIVRAYDARSGQLRWLWDPIPRSSEAAGWESWDSDEARSNGAANAWTILAADPARDLVFVPTTSSSPDYYGGNRVGLNLWASSIVALRASTGEFVWGFQTVHHDLWDLDNASQPALTTVQRNGEAVPAVVVNTKLGHVFVLHRETGEPLFPVEERPVPASDIPGEAAWPTQPFPVLPPPLWRADIEAWGVTPQAEAACRAQMDGWRNEGPFTPPTFAGTLVYPGQAGGANWGSAAVNPDHALMIVNLNHIPDRIRLARREDGPAALQADGLGIFQQAGTPYLLGRSVAWHDGIPCIPPPWGETVAVDLNTGDIRWRIPTGPFKTLAQRFPEAADWGSLNHGGPMVTGGDLVFVSAANDEMLRALDIETGAELWSTELMAGGQATPMTYAVDGRQYVVIAAGGHGFIRTRKGDYVMAFALPE